MTTRIPPVRTILAAIALAVIALYCAACSDAPTRPAQVEVEEGPYHFPPPPPSLEAKLIEANVALNKYLQEYTALGGRLNVSSGNSPLGAHEPVVFVEVLGIPGGVAESRTSTTCTVTAIKPVHGTVTVSGYPFGTCGTLFAQVWVYPDPQWAVAYWIINGVRVNQASSPYTVSPLQDVVAQPVLHCLHAVC